MYSLNDLTLITGMSSRTLRNYLKLGFLEGEKQNGVWQFTEEEVESFLGSEAVKPSLRARRNALVYDFLAEGRKAANSQCVILDLVGSEKETRRTADFFCGAVSRCPEGAGVSFNYCWEKGRARVMLSGGEALIRDIMREYYGT